MKRRIVITGLGIVSPIGIGKENYWDSLRNGRSGAGRVTFFDTSTYTCQIDAEVKNFQPENYIDKKTIRRMDRFTQFALAAADMAVRDAGLDTAKVDPERVGIIVGSGIGGLSTIEEEHTVLRERGARRVSPFLIPRLITNIAPGEIAIRWGFRGPNYAVSSACATSNHAIGDAVRMLRYGDADVIVAGGSESAITPLGFAGFCAARTLSTRNDAPEKASRPFDKDRDGFVMGEGAGIVVLETLEHAVARGAHVYGELAGYGATDDAYHITAPNPDAVSGDQSDAGRAQGRRYAAGGGPIYQRARDLDEFKRQDGNQGAQGCFRRPCPEAGHFFDQIHDGSLAGSGRRRRADRDAALHAEQAGSSNDQL